MMQKIIVTQNTGDLISNKIFPERREKKIKKTVPKTALANVELCDIVF